MARVDHPVHELIVDKLGDREPSEVLDLGCGTGPTLAAVARRWPRAHLVGVDLKPANIEVAARNLAGSVTDLRAADLDEPLDLPDDSIEAIVCHNTLECLADPVRLMDEAARVLKPGGWAVWSHTDFDTIVANTADVELSRRVLHGYADLAQPWMAHSDARMGRKLGGLIRRSRLTLADLDTQVLIDRDLSTLVADRIDNITAALAGHASLARDVERWRHEVDDAVAAGDFLFAETTFVVTTSVA